MIRWTRRVASTPYFTQAALTYLIDATEVIGITNRSTHPSNALLVRQTVVVPGKSS